MFPCNTFVQGGAGIRGTFEDSRLDRDQRRARENAPGSALSLANHSPPLPLFGEESRQILLNLRRHIPDSKNKASRDSPQVWCATSFAFSVRKSSAHLF